MRIYSFLVFATLAACGGAEQKGNPQAEQASAPKVACALAGASSFDDACSLGHQGDILTLSAPDGGFRRLRIVRSGIEAADGAEVARVTPLPDMIEVRIGGDAYRLPAQIR